MATETVSIRLDETWKLISADNAAAMKWEVVSFGDALFAVADSAPAAGSFVGMRDRDIPPTVWGTGKVYARAVRDTARVMVTRTQNAGNASATALQALTLSASTFSTGAPSGTVVGAIQNKTAGSTLRLLTNTKRFAVTSDGASLVVGLDPSAPGKQTITIRETHPDGGDNDTTLEVTGSAPALTITGSPAAAPEGQDYSWRPIVAGGYGERAFRFAGSLPAGWSVSSTTGAIYAPAPYVRSGTSISGISIAVTDESGQTATLSNISITVGVLPLPALPLPAGTMIAGMGDSQTAFNSGTPIVGAPALNTSPTGPISFAYALDPRFAFDSWYDSSITYNQRTWQGANQGIAGDHLIYAGQPTFGNGIIARLPELLKGNSKLVVFVGGFNTLNSGDGENTASREAYMKNCYQQIIDTIINSGRHLVLMTLYPSDLWAPGDTRYTILSNINAWMRALPARAGLTICDPYDTLAPGGVLDATMFQVDVGAHIHLSPKGALIVARDFLLPILQSKISAGTDFDQNQSSGNFIPAAQAEMQGTTGTNTSGPTGQVATSWNVRRQRGTAAVVNSKEGSSAPYKQVLTITPDGNTTNPNQVTLRLAALTSGLPAAGSWIRGAIKVELTNAAAVGLVFLSLEFKDSVANAVRQQPQGMYASFSTFGEWYTAPDRTLWLVTPPTLVTSETFDQLNIFSDLFFDGESSQGAIVAKFSKPKVFQVPDPRPIWGY